MSRFMPGTKEQAERLWKERQRRQHETSLMTKCSCGNVAKKGTTQCGRCAEADEHEAQIEEELSFSTTVDDLKDFIRNHLLP